MYRVYKIIVYRVYKIIVDMDVLKKVKVIFDKFLYNCSEGLD